MERASGLHPSAVALRKETNFRCANPDCDSVILTYHHFDPSWRERQHNEVEGMIALCPECHWRAEGGAWTKEKLREFKKHAGAPRPFQDDLIRPEKSKKALYRLGGNYIFSCPNILIGADVPLLGESRSEDGRLLFNLQILDERNNLLVVIHENSLAVDTLENYDCYYSPKANHLIVRRRQRKVILELRLCRLTMDALQESISSESSDGAVPQKILKHLAPELREKFARCQWDRDYRRQSFDKFFEAVRDQALGSDGTMVLVDIIRANLHANGRWIPIRNGQVANLICSNNLFWNCDNVFRIDGYCRLPKYYSEMRRSFTAADAFIIQREQFLNERSTERNAQVEKIYGEALREFPATMAAAGGIFGAQMLVRPAHL